jgi:hypothetical protein
MHLVCTPLDQTGSLVALGTETKEVLLGRGISSLSAGELHCNPRAMTVAASGKIDNRAWSRLKFLTNASAMPVPANGPDEAKLQA